MSFILEDEKLINELIKVAQEVSDVRSTWPNLDKWKLALKALQNLKEQATSSTISMANEEPKEQDLIGLPQLLGYLNRHGLTIKDTNERIVLDNNSYASLNDDEKKKYIFITSIFYANEKALITFLTDLRSRATNSGNIYFTELVGKLIEDISNIDMFKGKIPAEEKQKVKPIDFDDIDNETVLDIIPTHIDLNTEEQLGAFKLMKKHLDNKEGLDVLKSTIFINFGGEDVQLNDNDMCKFLYYLYKRASTKLNKDRSANNQYYVKTVKDRMGDFNCSIKNVLPDNSNKNKDNGKGQFVSYKQDEKQSALSAEDESELQHLGLPFERGILNIDKYNSFLFEIYKLLDKKQIIDTLDLDANVIRNAGANVTRQITAYEDVASNVRSLRFNFNDLGSLQEDTVRQYNNNSTVAYQAVNRLAGVCQYLLLVVEELERNATMQSIYGKSELQNQITIGETYLKYLGDVGKDIQRSLTGRT